MKNTFITYIKGVEKHIKAHIENLNCTNPNIKGKFNYIQFIQLSLKISYIYQNLLHSSYYMSRLKLLKEDWL